MANLPAAKKSIRTDKKRQERNKAFKSELKTLIKKIENLINEKKQKEAIEFLPTVMSKLDKGVKNNIIKKNAASRKKARLSSKVAMSGTS